MLNLLDDHLFILYININNLYIIYNNLMSKKIVDIGIQILYNIRNRG